MALVLSACGSDTGDELDAAADIPGLAEADEQPLIRSQPDPSDDSFTWSHVYRVGGLPPTNVGRPTPAFLADALRDPGETEELLCLGSDGSVGCGALDSPGPEVIGLTLGGADVLAWAWRGVPDQAAAVRFTDQNGTATWQRVIDRLVIFPDTIAFDPDGHCPCRFEAIDADGVVIATVDMETGTYINR
jgi:hypothetical protein